jgi:3-oxoacyl-[acyl-carrier-protein] synthase-1
MSEPVVIVAMGASTALGRDAWSSAAAVRAGISSFSQHPYMIDSAGEPMRAAIVPWLDIGLAGIDRFEALLFPAIEQALEAIAQVSPRPSLALALGLPSPRPGLPEDLQAQLTRRLRARPGPPFTAAACFAAGHAAGLVALHAAFNKLQQGGLDACLVASVDSYIEPETLEWLEANDQLHSAGPLNNAWGFIPGEGAGALLLMRAGLAQQLGLAPLAQVLGVGLATEPKRIKTETICIGEGLTQAFRGALAALPPGAQVSDVYCDMNGEPYRADEYGFTCLRTKEHFISASDFLAPADCWGDVAAAGAVLHLMLACAAGHKGYGRGPFGFAWASGEAGERAATLIATAAGPRQEAP